MRDVSLVRLYLLRATYLLIAVGLGLTIWPLILNPPPDLEHMRGVVWGLLAGVSLMAVVGLRYPLQMLPLLLFELVWKTVWMLAIGLPRWSAGTLDAGIQQSLFDCAVGLVLVPLVIPWRYVAANYLRRPGDRWRREAASVVTGDMEGSGQGPEGYRTLA
jgi:hypothetical protein